MPKDVKITCEKIIEVFVNDNQKKVTANRLIAVIKETAGRSDGTRKNYLRYLRELGKIKAIEFGVFEIIDPRITTVEKTPEPKEETEEEKSRGGLFEWTRQSNEKVW